MLREPEQRVGRLLIRVAREVRMMVERQVEPLGLTMQQAELLVWTHLHRGASPRQLTDLVLTDEAGISRLVDRLEAKKLVIRRGDGMDRRASVLELTPTGRGAVTRLRRFALAGNRRLLAGLSPHEVAQLRRLLLRVSENARRFPQVVR
jgi:DNA-binding MarR family transcriptional regulator